MGFPSYMDEVDRSAPLPFQGKFLKYHDMKDRLKVLVDLQSAKEKEDGEQAFLSDLQVQVREINRYEDALISPLAANIKHVEPLTNMQAFRSHSAEACGLTNSHTAKACGTAGSTLQAVGACQYDRLWQREKAASSKSFSARPVRPQAFLGACNICCFETGRHSDRSFVCALS